jgi:hypothetical protein
MGNLAHMSAVIETSIDTPDGIADCRIESCENGDELYYNVTILYPNTTGGYNRSEVYSHDMYKDDSCNYQFDPSDENIHPKIKRLEEKLAEVIKAGE